MDADLSTFLLIGFLAQLIDGALGMAFGVVASTSLLAAGMPPVLISAAVHAAEMFTTGASALSHVWHGNVDRRLFLRLAAAGMAGGVLGAYLLAAVIPDDIVRPLVTVYLFAMALLMLARVYGDVPGPKLPPTVVGAVGGLIDATGGGGWGPFVASTLMAGGIKPRRSIGTTNTAEFFVTVSVSATFLATLDLSAYGTAVLGLALGGVAAAPLAGWLVRVLPSRLILILAGGLLVSFSLVNLLQLFA